MIVNAIRIEYGKTEQAKVAIVESRNPMFSWSNIASLGERQEAYRVSVKHGAKTVWQTEWVKSDAQEHRYEGSALQSGEVYAVEVSVRGTDCSESVPCVRKFCPGAIENWDAAWLCAEDLPNDAVIDFFADIPIAKEIKTACMFVCGLGYQKTLINGKYVFSEPMNPAYSQYDRRSYYTVIPEVENALQIGKNRIAVRVAAGWRNPENACYRLTGRVSTYAGKTVLSALLRVCYRDGSVAWFKTNERWQYIRDAVASGDIFMGERREQDRFVENWFLPETDLPQAKCANITSAPCAKLQPQTLAPIAQHEIYPARTCQNVASGVWSVDFGQNIAGVCRIRIPRNIAPGAVITIHHMEFLDEDGRLLLPQLRNASSVDTYVAAGNGLDPEWWQPEFTYHGFRYAEVEGYPRPLARDDIQVVSLYTDVFTNGFFTCGDPLINQIYRNALQTEKANIHSVLTDCPQRDERMGWLNDATVRFECTPYIADVGRLFPKVVRDCMDVQDADGSITCTAPFAFGRRPADPVCSSYIVAGWQAYLHTGNADILAEGYDGFAAWENCLRRNSTDGIVNYSYYGDWAGPAYACQSDEIAMSKVTPGILMSTGYSYFNCVLLARIANILGKSEDAKQWTEAAHSIQSAFLKKWWNAESGLVATGSQGCQAFALWLEILPEEGRQKAADVLHRDLVEREYKFTTGNLCTRYMIEMLTKYGYLEDAWALLTRHEYPSIGYMIENEATTVWERFELKKNPGMNSHNHPMHASSSRWLFACLAGLEPTQPGWRCFRAKPCFPEKLLSASAGVSTPYGDVNLRWVDRYGARYVYLQVPVGAKALVELPGMAPVEVNSGFHRWEIQK